MVLDTGSILSMADTLGVFSVFLNKVTTLTGIAAKFKSGTVFTIYRRIFYNVFLIEISLQKAIKT